MNWQTSPYTVPLLIIGLITLASAGFTYRQRQVAGSGNLLALLLSISIWVFAYIAELSAVSLESKVFWAKVEYFGIVYLPVGFALFTLKYIGDFQKIKQQQRVTGFLLIIPVLTLILTLTNDWHHLIWTSTQITQQDGFNYLIVEHGLWFWINVGYVYLLLSSSTYWLVRSIYATPEQFRGQTILLIVGSLCPWIGNILYITNTNPFPNLDPTPFAFAITAICFTLALLRFKFLNIVPLARELVVDKLDNGVIVLDNHDRVLDINQIAANLLEKEKKQLIGQPIRFNHPGWAALEDALHQKIVTKLELSIHKTFYEVSVVQLENINNRANGRLITLHNITRRKETEVLLQQAKETAEAANQAKTHFLTNMSHEIRTPLNAVVGMTEMLRQTNLNAHQNELVDVVAESSNALMLLINNILDFSRLEAGNINLKRRAFDLVDCVEASLEAVQQAANDKLIKLSYVLEEGTPTQLAGDPVRLRQILVNLLENGVKFSEEGTVKITIGHIQRKNGILLDFVIQDSGIGIEAGQIDQLFLPFQQGDGSLTRSHGGNGLGLIICKRLVELMGGEISVHSEIGQGTSVHFTAHMNLPTKNEPLAVTLRQNRASLAGKRLLIIAGDATQRRQISKEARMAGLDVYVAASNQEASYWIDRSLPFNLVMLDINVWHNNPGILAYLQNKETRSPLPTVLLGSSTEDLSRTILAEPNLFAGTLTLPIEGPKLYDLLINILSVKATPSKNREPGESMAAQHPLDILLVEDNKLNQRVLMNMLDKLGYKADMAGNGRIAVELAQDQPYQIILMDIQMPEMDGIEATKQILTQATPNKRPYIVAVTAHALPGDRETYLAAGMNQYLSKPVTINKLVEVLYQGIEFQNRSSVSEPLCAALPNTPLSSPEIADEPIDMEGLAHLVGKETREFLTMMTPIFLEDTQKLLQSLTIAAENNDSLMIKQVAHTLKGTSASMSMPRLTQYSRELEAMAQANEFERLPEKLADIKAEYHRVQLALENIPEAAV